MAETDSKVSCCRKFCFLPPFNLSHSWTNTVPQETAMDAEMADDQIVTPWVVESKDGIDYDKLINQFGSQRISEELIQRMEVTCHN